LINYVTTYFLNIQKGTNGNRIVTLYLDRNRFDVVIGCEIVNKSLYGLLVVITTALMGSAFAIGKVGLAYASPVLLVSFRFIIAGVLMGIFVWFWTRPHPNKLKQWWHIFVIGFFQTAGVMGCIFVSLKTITAGESSILTF